MRRFDEKIQQIETQLSESPLNWLSRGAKAVGRTAVDTARGVADTVSDVAKTGTSIASGVGNAALGAATLNPKRVETGLKQSVGTVAQGVKGVVDSSVDSAKAAGKAFKSGKPIMGALHAASVAQGPVTAGRQFMRSAANSNKNSRTTT